MAKVAFLSRDEWEADLRSLLEDFRDEEGNIIDLKHFDDAAKAARDKVRLFEFDVLQTFDTFHRSFPLSTAISGKSCTINRSSID